MGPENVFDQYYTFSSNSEELIESFPTRLTAELYEIYIREFGRFAAKVHLKVPWFVPTEFGGVGLKSFGRHGPTALDRAVCSLLYHDGLVVAKATKATPWAFHQGVQQMLPSCLSLSSEDSDFDDWYGYATKVHFQNSVFYEDFGLIYRDTAKDGQRVIRKNEKIWSRYVRAAAKRQPRYDFEFPVGSRLRPVVRSPVEGPCLF
jgi:hypothetical protein